MQKEVLTSYDTLKKVWTKVYNEWLVMRADPANKGKIPTEFSSMPMKTYSKPGQQQFTTVGDSTHLERKLQLRTEILRVMARLYDAAKRGGNLADVTNANLITSILNEDRKRLPISRPQNISGNIENQIEKNLSAITVDEVKDQIQLITIARNRQGKNPKTYSQLISETEKMQAETKGTLGYDDLETTREIVALHFSGEKVDASTKAKLGKTEGIVFNPPIKDKAERFNYTSAQLASLRAAKEKQYPETATEVEYTPTVVKEIKKAKKPKPTDKIVDKKPVGIEPNKKPVEMPAKEPLPSEIEIAPEKTKKRTEPDDIKGKKSELPSHPQSKQKVDPPQKKQPEKPKSKEKSKSKGSKDIVSHTLSNLIVIAESLDKEGKGNAAEEIHKIIRKYQERL
jgi:outer membrane biosynthesis protein TonB